MHAIAKKPIITHIMTGCDNEFDGNDGTGFVVVPTANLQVSDFATAPITPVFTSS